MADRAGTHPVGAAVQNILLATKLHIPVRRAGLVPRSRLLERLTPSVGLIVVCAPAGYGKTVLLADWAQLEERVAWLSLDAGDNDQVRFWRHVSAALDTVRPGIMERLQTMLGPPAPSSFEPIVTALVNEFEDGSTGDEVRLVLDDYHVLDSPEVHASVGFLLAHLPPTLRVAIATRTDPPLALARFRAHGQLVELRAADLRFTLDEATSLLHNARSELSRTAVEALAARTEGWAVGLQLAALSLSANVDPAAFVTAFTGSHRYVLDYLGEEVLNSQSEQVRIFLLETSLLERGSGSLCDAVTGRTDSQALLEALERAGLFLVPLDEVRGWWRYHHLFADLLRARVEQERPDRIPEVHRAAAGWYEQRGLADDAIHHALASGEMTWAARLVEQHFDGVFNLRGEDATIRRWLPAIPDEVVRRRPRLLLAQSQMAGMRGDVEAMLPLIDAAEKEAASIADETFQPAVGRASSLLVNIPAVIELQRSLIAQFCNDAEKARLHASRAAELVSDDESMLASTVKGFRAVAHWMQGDLAKAERMFRAGVGSWRSAGELTHAAWGSFTLARIQCARGELDAALDTCTVALRDTSPAGRPPLPTAGPAYVAWANVAYQRNDLATARETATMGIAACREFVYTPPLAAGLCTMAFVRQAAGDPVGALDAMDEAEHLSHGPPGLFNPIPARRARLLLLQGDVDGAARWAEQCGLTPVDAPDYPREQGQLVLARVLLTQGRCDVAMPLLERLHAAALGQGRVTSVIEISALQALALAACGDQDRAVDALANALEQAYPQRFIRLIADEGAPMAELVARLVAARRHRDPAEQIAGGYLADLYDALAGDAGAPDGAGVPGMIEQLTARELEVLILMASGASNRSIAGELFVTVDTIKKHVSHVLLKLGATNRTEAVTRARDLRLIS